MKEQSKIVERIASESGVPDLLTLLSDRLSGTDLKSLMLEVYARRASRQTPAGLVAQFGKDPFVKPSPTNPVELLAMDQLAFSLAQALFEPIELAPICPLGTIAALAHLHQNRIVTTTRGVEVISDSTNVLALECARRRRVQGSGATPVRLCASHRLLRPGVDLKPKDLPHFRMFGLCSATRRGKGFEEELEELRHHLRFHIGFLEALNQESGGGGRTRVAVSDFSQKWIELLESDLIRGLKAEFHEVLFTFDLDRDAGRGYYPNVCFHIYIEQAGEELFVADGGFVDWTQELLQDRHERLMISGIGTERLCGIYETKRNP